MVPISEPDSPEIGTQQSRKWNSKVPKMEHSSDYIKTLREDVNVEDPEPRPADSMPEPLVIENATPNASLVSPEARVRQQFAFDGDDFDILTTNDINRLKLVQLCVL